MKSGQTIYHYRIEEKLGEGGMGVVYKTHDTKLDRTVALKFLPSQVGADDEEKQRFINEAKAASALDHSNICAIHSIDETGEGNLFIVMAYYEGISLKQKIDKGPLPLKDVVNYAIQIVSGIQKAHEKGVIHRDLKPANILITNDDQVKIIDFGLAKAAQQTLLTKSGATLGTVPYMSPEQARGEKVDHRTDIWSLGGVMYEMVTGQRPFKSDYEMALVYSIIKEDPLPVTDISPEVPVSIDTIVLKCLEKDPDHRYQHTDELAVDLRKVEKEISSGIRSNIASPSREETTQSDKRVSSDHQPVRQKIQPWVYGIPVLLLLLIGLYFFLPDRTAGPELDNSVAVLPFENLSPDPDDAYFTDGVHDDIITQLSQIRDLRVIARSSVMNYPVGSRDYRQIGEELDVSTVMEGSIRRAGDVVRVSVQLVDLQTMETLWAEMYERDLIDIFTIQNQIAREISSSIRVSMTREEEEQLETPLTDNPEAYDMYLKAGEYLRRPGSEQRDWDIAIYFLEKAVELDPEFTAAVASLSNRHANYYWFGHDQTPERLEKAKRYAERAYELDPDSEFANNAMGNYYYRSRDYARALSYLNKTTNYALTAYVQRRMGLWDESIENLKKAIDRNPLSSAPLYGLATSYWGLRNYEKAEEYYKRALDVAPDFTGAKVRLAGLYIAWKGDVEPLRNFVAQNPDAYPYIFFILRNFEGMLQSVEKNDEDIFTGQYNVTPASYFTGLAYTYLGDTQTAEDHFKTAQTVLEELLQEQPEDYRIRARLSNVYAYLGEPEPAIREAEKVMELVPLEYDSMLGTEYIINAAQVYAIVGEADKATQLLDKALEIPSMISRNRIKIGPVWDSIREHESFRQLIAEEME